MALKFIRDNLKSFYWILWIVILAMAGLVFFEWGGYSQSAGAGNEIAATVGGQEITFNDFRRAHQRLESYYRELMGESANDEMLKQFNLPAQALNQLINDRILLMEARDIGLTVTDGEVREVIVNDPNLQRDGRFVGEEEYEALLRRVRLSPREYHDSIRQGLLLQKLDSVLASTSYVSDADVEKAYREQVERAKIRYLQLPASQMDAVTLEDSELAAYLAERPEDFEIPEQRVVDYLLVDTGKLRQEIVIPDEELRAYYDANQDQYTRKEQVRARHILRKVTPDRSDEAARSEIEDVKRRIEAGEDFATLARELSEDDVSARNGGSLGSFGRGAMLPEFEEAAFNAGDGELVGPVRTTFGYHLIEKQGSTPAGVQPFEPVQASIRARLLSERSTNMAQEKALDVAGRLTAEMTDEELRALAGDEGLEVVTTEPFGVDDTVAGLGRSVTFNQTAFGLEAGGVSDPVRVPRGWAVMKLKEVREPRSPELAEVEAEVRQAMLGERRKEAAVARLEEAVASGTGLDDLAGALGLEVAESAEFGSTGTIAGLGSHREVIDAALSLDVGQTGGPFATDQGAVIFEVSERKVFDPGEFEAARESTRASQEQQRVQELKRTILAKRRRDLPTNYNPTVFESFGIEPDQGQG